MSQWKPVGSLDPRSLVEPRLQLHYALLTLASVAASLIPKRPDWSHGSVDFDPEGNRFLGQPLAGGMRAVLAVEGLEISLLDDGGSSVGAKSLFGSTLQQGHEWFKTTIGARGIDVAGFREQKFGDFPEHALDSGAAFDASQQAGIREVALYFENTMRYLQELTLRDKRASAIRLWPHHCDIATLITIKEPSEPGGEDGQSVGVGFSPGDGGTPEPYWYVTPWPYPDPATLPALAAGRWNTDGWVGAVLESSSLSKEVDTQREQTHGFLDAAVGALLT